MTEPAPYDAYRRTGYPEMQVWTLSTRVLQGRYRLDEVVDSGATATVWRARDVQLDRPVAIKILDRPWRGVDSEEGLRFRDEARALARLAHPNIVTVFDIGTEDGFSFLIMELVEGRTARAWLDDGVLSIGEAAAVMAQVCDALAAAHAAGVVHRDIKPGNIVVTPGGTAKLCDFGIARMQDTIALTAPNIALGTTSYMAPEQIEGKALDGRADLYAVGCVLFEMLTGAPPFVGDTAYAVAYQHLHDKPPRLGSRRAGVPPGLDGLVGRLLAKDPNRRPATAAQVRTALKAHADRTTVAIFGPVVPARQARNLYAWAGLAAAVAVAVPAIVFAAWPKQQATAPPVVADSTQPASSQATPTSDPSAVPIGSVLPTAVEQPGGPEATMPAPVMPNPSVPAAEQSPLEQVMALKALVRQLSDGGELGAKEAGDLDHLLNDLASRIVQNRVREAQDKIAEIRRKNNDYLDDGKITVAGHDEIESRLVRLSEAVATTAS